MSRSTPPPAASPTSPERAAVPEDVEREGNGRRMRRLLEAEEAAEASLADARAEAERIHAEARAEARAIAERAERRVGLMHRIADEAIERETERLEAEGERRRAHVRETRLDDEVLARAAERVAAALSGAEGA